MAKGVKNTRKSGIVRKFTMKRIGKLTHKAIKLVDRYDPAGDPIKNLNILARAAEDIDMYLGETNSDRLSDFQSYMHPIVERLHGEITLVLDQIKLAKQVAHGAKAANENDDLLRMFGMLGLGK